ncbi:AMP-binding protein [Streptomyces massasporeus]|uniref:AMP-binding protein n=1 Tax=Streptomyces massasporeus TaxID=67324 RepID=UPI0036ED6D1C
MFDAYGSTETCGIIAAVRPEGPRADGSCGPPVPGVEVRVVEPRSGADVRDAAEGEVWVRSPGLSPRTRRERAERAVRIPPSSRIVRDP